MSTTARTRRTTASSRTESAERSEPVCFSGGADDGGDPGAASRGRAGNSLPSTSWPARPRSWTSSAASSAYQTGGIPGTCPTWRPRAWRRCCAGRGDAPMSEHRSERQRARSGAVGRGAGAREGAAPGLAARWSSWSCSPSSRCWPRYVLISTITNAGYGEQLTYRAEFSDVAGLVEGDEVRIAGVRVGQIIGIGLAEETDRPSPRSSSRSAPTSRCPPTWRRSSGTATSSASATSR